MDQIKITELEVFAKHGVFPEENTLGQKFLISATLYTDTRAAGMTDDLSHSIHYGDVSHFIEVYMKEHTFKLIETVAEQLAMEMLLKIEHLQQVTLEIQKPWAPVGLPLKTVSVQITRSWHDVYLALGSNLGEKKEYLNKAVKKLKKINGIEVVDISSYIETAPYGVTDQPAFLNGAVRIRTLLTPKELLRTIHALEQDAGRKREIHWGPRTLDIDILFYDDLILNTPELIIPHVEIQKRDFVLKPLMELCPYMRHPVWHETVAEMYEKIAGEN